MGGVEFYRKVKSLVFFFSWGRKKGEMHNRLIQCFIYFIYLFDRESIMPVIREIS